MISILSILLMSNTILYPGKIVNFHDLEKKSYTKKFPGRGEKLSNTNIEKSDICHYRKVKEPLLAFTLGGIIFGTMLYFFPMETPSQKMYHLRHTPEKYSQNNLYQLPKENTNQEIIQNIHNLIHQYQTITNNNQPWIHINETENHTIKNVEKIAE